MSTEEIAIVELTLEQTLEMRYDEVVGTAIEEALDADPQFYRPFEKLKDQALTYEKEKCDAACVTAKLKNEKPNPKIDGTRRDIKREQAIRASA